MPDLISKEDLKEPYIVIKDLQIKDFSDFNNYFKSIVNHTEFLDSLDSNNHFIQLLNFGNAIASEIRLKILHFINLVEVTCFCELESVFKIKLSTLNYHIKLLVRANLVETSKKGKNIIIKLSRDFDSIIPTNLLNSFRKMNT